MNEDDLEKQIGELQTQLNLLRSKRNRLKNPHSLTMTIDEAAGLLGISRATAYTAAQSGEIPTIRIGKRYLVPIAAIQKLLDNAKNAMATNGH